MKIKRKLNKKFFILIIITITIILISLGVYNHYKYINSISYKLSKLGYPKDDVKLIIEKDISVDVALREYNASFTKFISSKYFMRNRLERYLSYYKKHQDINIDKVVSIVNANTDKDFYTDIKISSGDNLLIIVNKYYGLESAFVPTDLVNISTQYAYTGHTIRAEVNDKYIEMAKAAKKEGLTLIVNSSYRSYERQDDTYSSLVSKYGKIEADKLAAKPGHSEHQTGLALDITTKLVDDEEFKDTEESTWLKNNAYKYGFILRYPEDKEDITGYSYEPWHYRYVGIDVAKKIYEENITFDEYYAYYIENTIK